MSKTLYTIYKFGNWLYSNRLGCISLLINYFIRIVFSAWIPSSATIGPGTRFGYAGLGIVIHDRAVIGSNCLIDQNVTIGGTSRKAEVPVVGNEVYIGAGAKLIGPIVIGNNVVIGANSVVVDSIPDNSLVVGVPGKVIKSGIYKNEYV